jgi:O-antigen ligase
MSSRFVSFEIGSTGVGMWEADHMHNAFLDVLYNNGLLGFSLILTMHSTIIMLLWRVIRASRSRPDQAILNAIAIAALAVYVNLLINAFFNATIGGRPSTLNLLFFATFVLAHTIYRLQHRSGHSVSSAESSTPRRGFLPVVADC